jgi:hypothetical protein
MSVHQYAVGMGATILVVLCAAIVGLVGRRLFAPRWTGAIAALVVVVVGYSFLVVEGELLGTFGAFKRTPIVIASVAVAAVALLLGRGRGPAKQPADPEAPDLEAPPAPRVDVLPRRRSFTSLPSWIASACGALVLAQGLVAVRATARTGNVFIDAVQYHLTMAARFATSHHTGTIVQLAPGSPVSYYPFNSELLHGMGIALLQRDSLSLVLTLVDLGAALLAAWCVGSAFDAGPVALCAVTPVLALLGIYDASAINDWMALWPLIAVLAIAAHFRKDGDDATVGLPFLAGLAGGLAMGTKLSLLAPTGALLIGFLVLVSNRRKPAATILVVIGAAITSVYWYVRDAVGVGSPLPSEHIPGLTRVPMAGFQQFGYSVAHYLGNSTVIRQYFHPGLEFFFGKAWIAILALAVLGVVLAVVLGPATWRLAGIVAVIATGAYLVTPSGAFGPPGHPYLFEYNVRYALPAVLLGLLALGGSRVGRRWPIAMSAVFLACLVATLLGPRVWALGTKDCAAAAAIALVVAAAVRLPLVRRFGTVLAVIAVLALAAGGYAANKSYLRDRYHDLADSKGALYASLQDQSGVRIGVIGTALYPFLGPTFTNTVSYIGETEAHHAFVDYPTCSAWRAAVVAGGYAYIVIETSAGNPPPPQLDWAQSDPDVTPVVTNDAGGVFEVGPGFGSALCSD